VIACFKNKKKKQHYKSPEFRSKVILLYTPDLGETLKRILERHRIQTLIKLSTVLSSGNDTVPASKRRGVLYMKFHVELWTQIHGRNETKHSTERTPQGHLTYRYS